MKKINFDAFFLYRQPNIQYCNKQFLINIESIPLLRIIYYTNFLRICNYFIIYCKYHSYVKVE